METPEIKHCPICTKDLPVDEFGICRSRKDGHNLYCKGCIRKKVARNRRVLREYREARKKYVELQVEISETVYDGHPVLSLSKLSPVERVKEAIGSGARTQTEIAAQTKLGKDEIGDAIANLLLWTHEIKTRLDGETRLYFLNEVEEKPEVIYPQAEPYREVMRKANATVIQGERRIQKVA